MRINPFLTSLPQVMILVTPMIIPMKLFGLRLPEVCGEWPIWRSYYKRGGGKPHSSPPLLRFYARPYQTGIGERASESPETFTPDVLQVPRLW